MRADLMARESGFSVVFQRFFLSERGQIKELPSETGAVSYIIQPPLDGSRAALWIYLVSDAEVSYSDGMTCVKADGLEHIWHSSFSSGASDSFSQTTGILEDYSAALERKGCSLADNCVRTWLFVDDIDNNYLGMVESRREFFEKCGLTSRTHYIASTGICGKPAAESSVVQMDAYSIKGDFRQRYLYAPTHLNPTYEYGVTFERGVAVDYSGKNHVFISGTASIDNKGNVMHVGDIAGQTSRMLENVEVLLSEGDCGWQDVRMAIVYLRNSGDYAAAAPVLAERLSGVPYVVTLAPVCRPQWLIEIECIGLR